MKSIVVAGVDPSLANFGLCRMSLDLNTMELDVIALKLIATERQVTKNIRVNSDDLRRAQQLLAGFKDGVTGCAVVFAEVPHGAQSARGALSNGISIGILAGSPIPLVQVRAIETKLASVGKKTASKADMIDWASETYPTAKWITHKKKGRWVFNNSNEHLADAVAVVHAGIKTDQFKQIMAMWKATNG